MSMGSCLEKRIEQRTVVPFALCDRIVEYGCLVCNPPPKNLLPQDTEGQAQSSIKYNSKQILEIEKDGDITSELQYIAH
jgi:hypothetical protein